MTQQHKEFHFRKYMHHRMIQLLIPSTHFLFYRYREYYKGKLVPLT